MSNRKDIIKELKEDAKRAWDFIETCATNIGKYGLLVLSLYSDGSESQQKFEPIKEQQIRNEINVAKLDKKLQVVDLKDDKGFIWDDTLNNMSYLTMSQNIDERVDDIYKSTFGAKIDGKINISELMEKTGVKVEDMQIVVNENKDILTKLEPGNISSRLAKAADRVKGELNQNCLFGVQNIFMNAGYGNYLDGSNGLWPKKIGNGPYNSACNTNKTLEKTGEFITLSVENKACNTSIQSTENKEMKEFCRGLPAGTIVVCDNKLPDQIEGRSYESLVRQYGKGGSIHGHVAVKANNGSFKSDGIEPSGPNFARYGENVSFSIPTDMRIPKDVAYAFIKQAEIRKSKEKEAKNKTTTAYNQYNSILLRNASVRS